MTNCFSLKFAISPVPGSDLNGKHAGKLGCCLIGNADRARAKHQCIMPQQHDFNLMSVLLFNSKMRCIYLSAARYRSADWPLLVGVSKHRGMNRRQMAITACHDLDTDHSSTIQLTHRPPVEESTNSRTVISAKKSVFVYINVSNTRYNVDVTGLRMTQFIRSSRSDSRSYFSTKKI